MPIMYILNLSLLPRHIYADAAEAFYYRAELLKHQNRRAEAKKDYLKALELIPGDLRYSSGYAIFLYENNKHKEAVSLINMFK